MHQYFLHFRDVLLNLCNNSDQKCPSGRLKTSGFALGFQHFPQDLANVDEWKIMCDPSISIKLAVLLNLVIILWFPETFVDRGDIFYQWKVSMAYFLLCLYILIQVVRF